MHNYHDTINRGLNCFGQTSTYQNTAKPLTHASTSSSISVLQGIEMNLIRIMLY